MRRSFCIFGLVLLLAGCGNQQDDASVPSTAELEHTIPTVVSEISMSQEMAMLEGYVVMQDGDVRHNAGNWFDFLEKCREGMSSTVTVVQFESGSDYVRYDLSFDDNEYTVSYEENGRILTESSQILVIEDGLWKDTQEPYDSYEAYLLNDIVLYRDLIAEPDYEGVTEIFLHAKEGEPPVKSYTDAESVEAILQLLMTAQYAPAEPEDYAYGMKLLMTNRDGKELVIELDLNQGYYRYGMQTYTYGDISDLFAVLGIEQWPKSVLEEFSDYLK